MARAAAAQPQMANAISFSHVALVTASSNNRDCRVLRLAAALPRIIRQLTLLLLVSAAGYVLVTDTLLCQVCI
jgi:hypothetical protein